MGLAASQVRLLQLTSRQHRIEYQAQKIQAQKLQLANESDAAYNTYMAALDAKKVQYKYIDKYGNITYKDANYNTMFKWHKSDDENGVQNLYALERVKTGTLILDSNTIKVAKDIFNKPTPTYSDVVTKLTEYKDLTEAAYNEDADKYNHEYLRYLFSQQITNSSTDVAMLDYYNNLFDKISEYGVDKLEPMNVAYAESSEWLTNMLANAEVILLKWEVEGGDDGKGAWTESSVSTDLLLQEVSDEKELKKAEATYEAETTRINRKDAQYDTLLSQTETERSAIKTEMDSLKQVRNDNIDKTFKLFS